MWSIKTWLKAQFLTQAQIRRMNAFFLVMLVFLTLTQYCYQCDLAVIR